MQRGVRLNCGTVLDGKGRSGWMEMSVYVWCSVKVYCRIGRWGAGIADCHCQSVTVMNHSCLQSPSAVNNIAPPGTTFGIGTSTGPVAAAAILQSGRPNRISSRTDNLTVKPCQMLIVCFDLFDFRVCNFNNPPCSALE